MINYSPFGLSPPKTTNPNRPYFFGEERTVWEALINIQHLTLMNLWFAFSTFSELKTGCNYDQRLVFR